MLTLLLTHAAFGFVDPACEGLTKPDDYNEQAQQDFLLNYTALASTLSAVHGPIPHEPGHGAVGVDFNGMPPLGCERRLVLDYTKTEDTNKTPVIPRPRATFAFPEIAGLLIPYAGVAYVPPVTIFGTRNVILSGEFGVGMQFGEHWQLGARFHATSHRTIGEIATPFEPDEPAVDDLYLASTFGADAMVGFQHEKTVPYLSLGVVDASTFFYIGDDNVISNNFHPYFGLAFAAGVDTLIADRLRLGGEFYGAPGGYSLPDDSVESVDGFGRYGRIYTGRLRVAIEL